MKNNLLSPNNSAYCGSKEIPIRAVAVLGTGSIGYRHLNVLRSIGVKPIAVPIRQERRSELEAEGWVCATSLAAAVELGAEAVVIATDTARHIADLKEAVMHCLPVMVEKPLAASVANAVELHQVAIKYREKIVIGCPLRFDLGLAALRENLSEIGQIHSVQIECRSYLPDWRPGRDYRQGYWARAEEGGVLRDLIHEVDYGLWLFGKPVGIFGTLKAGSSLHIESEEAAQAIWIYENGLTLSIGLDYLTRKSRRSIIALGQSGEMEYDFITKKMRIATCGKNMNEQTFPSYPNDNYMRQMREFLLIACGGSSTQICSLNEGLTGLMVCDAWRDSAENLKCVLLS
ncbi:MAG: Gfo/Idh/MocA family oxidoreductase [bacterium]